MSTQVAMVVRCDAVHCDRVIMPVGVADDAPSRVEAREFARLHGWVTADRSASYTDLCPDHAAPGALWRSLPAKV